MSQAIKMAIGLGLGISGLTSLVVLFPAAAAHGPASRVVVVMFAALMFFWAATWCLRPWPKRRRSIGFIASCDVGIAAVALQDPNWLTGLYGFNAFALISIYLLFFDGPRGYVVHAVWILATTMLFVALVSAEVHASTLAMVARSLAVVAPTLGGGLGIQLGIWDLRNDANSALADPLTGLLNRRGLHLHIGNLLLDDTTDASEVVVMVADLDRFKNLNDTFGHIVGDEVLIRTAQRITSAVRGSALVARTGGEEFVIVDLTEPGGAERVADRVRFAIAAPAAHPTTASLGLHSVSRADFDRGGDPAIRLDGIIALADRALFDAKRQGGNVAINVARAEEHA